MLPIKELIFKTLKIPIGIIIDILRRVWKRSSGQMEKIYDLMDKKTETVDDLKKLKKVTINYSIGVKKWKIYDKKEIKF